MLVRFHTYTDTHIRYTHTWIYNIARWRRGREGGCDCCVGSLLTFERSQKHGLDPFKVFVSPGLFQLSMFSHWKWSLGKQRHGRALLSTPGDELKSPDRYGCEWVGKSAFLPCHHGVSAVSLISHWWVTRIASNYIKHFSALNCLLHLCLISLQKSCIFTGKTFIPFKLFR